MGLVVRAAAMKGGLIGRAVIASALLAVMVGGGFAALLIAIDELRTSGQAAIDAREELRAADSLEKTIVDLETGQRGFVITRRDRFLEPWRDARAAFPRQAARLVRRADTPIQERRAQRIARAGRAYIREYSLPLVNAARRNQAAARGIVTTAEGKRLVDALRAQFDRFVATERNLLTTRQQAADDDAQRAIVIAAAGIAGSVVLILLVGAYLMRAIVLPVRRTSEMADELARGDLAVRLPETGAAEIGTLERAFNRMGGSLEESQAELKASRARVVAAADETRSRIERDLHDGAQQSLVHAVITMKLARRALAEGNTETPKLVDESLGHAERANSELRELAHGILPAVLRRGGLRAGVEALVSRVALPVSVRVPAERLPPALEATAYFIVAEALTNVVKHARARRAEVSATVGGDQLQLEVRDDGVGGAKVEGSSGLLGLRDRAAALGGTLAVESPPGRGTVIAATLPVPQRAPGATESVSSE
jgi:signal transduction histidine kinase